MKIRVMVFTVLLLAASLAMADEQPSAARGKELFNSTTLGTNGKSCAGCHKSMSPKITEKDKWAPILKQGENQMVATVMKGKGRLTMADPTAGATR